MKVSDIKAVVGTNSWGSAAYGKILRGESVDESVLKSTFDCAKEKGVAVFDLAQDYGLGKAQKIFGRFGTDGVIVSSKFTPTGRYKKGQVRKSFEKDLTEFNRDYVDIYWLHLPNDIEKNLAEIIDLYREKKYVTSESQISRLKNVSLQNQFWMTREFPFMVCRIITASCAATGRRMA